MTTPMIHQVARAIADAVGDREIEAFHRDAARAALEALREPDEAMSAEGRRVFGQPLTSANSVWQAMVRTALQESACESITYTALGEEE